MSKGIDVNAKDGSGKTHMHVACKLDYLDSAHFVYRAGAGLSSETGIHCNRGPSYVGI